MEKEELYREAAGILLRLSEDPEDTKAIAERDAFLARGPDQKKAYEKAARAWNAAGQKRSGPSSSAIVVLAILFASVFIFANPWRVGWRADFSTAQATGTFVLQSGDTVVLDASSAIRDDTEMDVRAVTLLEGSAYFDVATDGRPFVINAQDVSIEVLGTAFEVAQFDQAIQISVTEGLVDVRAPAGSWQLAAEQNLYLTAEGEARLTQVTTDAVALWREDFLVTDGLTFAQVVDLLDRRMRGTVIVTSRELATGEMTGGLDLSEPERALRTLVAARGARLISAPFVGSLILPGN